MDPLTRYLLEDDAPHPGEDALRAFAEVAPPPALSRTTLLAALDEEPPANNNTAFQPASRRGWTRFVVAGIVMAAAALLVVRGGPPTGDVSSMTARGDTRRLPAVTLKVSAAVGDRIERLRTGQGYPPGTVLYFRVGADADGEVHLVQSAGGKSEIIASQLVVAGETDLRLGEGLLTWTIEERDPDSTFAIVSGPRDEVRDLGPSPCEEAKRRGLPCTSVIVDVTP